MEKKNLLGLPIILILLLFAVSACAGVSKEDIAKKDQQISSLQSQVTTLEKNKVTKEEMELRLGMRKLWEDHITWTRLYIVEAIGNLPSKDSTAARLLKNQEDIGNAIKPYYGDEAGNKLTALLKTHIAGAVDVLSAAKAGDKKRLADANKAWYDNANDIAVFLASANPTNWPSDAMKEGMKMHLDLTLSEAVAQLQGDYAASDSDYDKVHNHILGLADTLTDGIIKQFPQKFGK